MKIGVVSDTHGNLKNTERAVKLLKQHDLETILHCGDICGAEVVEMFSEWPTHFVAGNCDDPDLMRFAVEQAGQNWHGEFGDLTIGPRTIALLHGHDSTRFEAACRSEIYDLICYGHTHVHETHQQKATTILNPGALHRANPHTFAMVDLETMEVEFVPLG
ncbi:MAG: YfcE family phosphodiesterase [Planctomycetaceae bacterium]|nr:YfcE family phosphodiesterase [Planctomycetaceae bacterium]